MSINPGDRVIRKKDSLTGTVLRTYEEIDIAIVEYDVADREYIAKEYFSHLLPYKDPEPETKPVKKKLIDRVKEKILGGGYEY